MHFKLLINPKNLSDLYIIRAKEANFLLASLMHFVYTTSVVSVSLIINVPGTVRIQFSIKRGR